MSDSYGTLYPTNEEWPIRLQFLSKTKNVNEKYTPYRCGIYDSDTLRGFLADASDDVRINNPLSLFQVVPATYEFPNTGRIRFIDVPENICLRRILGSDRRVIRIDPGRLYMNMPCCNLFRKCNNGENTKKCFEQDSRIVILFNEGLAEIHFKNDFDRFTKKLQELIDQYNESLLDEEKVSSLTLERNRETQELYIWYKCQYSNLLEYFFPIVHSGTVVAVLMQGQRIPLGAGPNDLFPESRVGGKYEKKLDRSIKNLSGKVFRSQPMSDERLSAINEKIRILEKRIDKEVLDYARCYVSEEFLKIEEEFHNKLKEEIGDKESLGIEKYKKILNDVLERICKTFVSGGYINIYSTDQDFNESNTRNVSFYKIGTSLQDGPIHITDSFTFANLLESKIETISNNKLAKYLVRPQSFSEDEIFRIENLHIGKMKNLIWKKYPIWKQYYKEQFEIFSIFLKSAYHTLLEPYNMLRSVGLRDKLEASIRVSVHETSQIIPTIISTLEAEYNIDTIKLIREENLNTSQIKQRERTIFDTIQRLTLLDGLYKRSALIFKDLKPEEGWHDLHRVVYALQTLFQKTAFDNNRQYINIAKTPFFFHRYALFTDYSFLNHALFNLADNAIKYGYRGTNINLAISLPPEQLDFLRLGLYGKIDRIFISITSYGSEISEEDRKHIFKLFYRSSYSVKKEGMGIGLFLAKKLCDSLGYEIECKKSKLISKYNLPILYYGDCVNDEEDTISPSVDEDLMEKVVNQKSSAIDWKIGKSEYNLLLNEPIYQNEFLITIRKNHGIKQLLKDIKNINYEEDINY